VTLAALNEWFPRAFALDRPPLKIGVYHDLAERAPAITAKEVKEALRFHCGSPTYLYGLTVGAIRLDLDGSPAGTVTADEAANAKAMIAGIKAKRAKKRPATVRP